METVIELSPAFTVILYTIVPAIVGALTAVVVCVIMDRLP